MSDKKAVFALGFFDGVHKGHVRVIEKAEELAKKLNAVSVVFTFGGNLKGRLFGAKRILTESETLSSIKKIGDNEIFVAPVSDDFLSLTPEAFLNYLDEQYDVAGYACGEDYRFGKDALGNVAFLNEYALKRGKELSVVKSVEIGGQKVSSTRIKELLGEGDIVSANELLGYDYFITGEVFADRKIGGKLGFPTINLKVDAVKSELKVGVYAGYSVVCGKKYKAMINYGARPTFGLNDKLVEAHLIGFSGDLYGKTVSVCFTDYIREVRKFDGEEELKKQLFADKEFTEKSVK